MALTQVSSAGIKNAEVKTEDILDANITTAKVADNAITGAKVADNLDIPDNNKIRFGTGNDLQIYHDGSHSYIADSGTGDLVLKSDTTRIINAAGDENIARFLENGAVELYYNGSKTFETISGGAKITGHFVPSGTCNLGAGDNRFNDLYIGNDVVISDNGKVILGTGNDLQIYHDGSNSFVKNTTGRLDVSSTSYLYLESNDRVYIGNVGMSEVGAVFVKDGAVELYYDNSKKLATTSGGVHIYSALGTSGAISIGNSADLIFEDNGKAKFGFGNDLQIYHNGTNSVINNSTGNTFIQAGGGSLYLQAVDDENAVKIYPNAQVELYCNGVKQFSTGTYGAYTETDIALRCGSSGPVGAELFTVQRNSGQVAYFDHSGGDDHRVLQVRHRGATGSTYRTQIGFLDDNADEVGSVKSHGSSTQYNTASDYRLKENEVLISDGITRLKTLKPYRFNFKKTPGNTVDGFFAHEVTAVPEAIAGEKDGTKSQGLDYSKLTPLLTAALQEAITKIETLETKVAALEAK